MIVYLLFGVVLVLLAIAVVTAAVRSGTSEHVIADPVRARQDVAIEALRALEFEYQTGKLPQEEYGRLRRELEVEAVRARDEAQAGARDDSAHLVAGDESAGGKRVCADCDHDLEGGESFCPACGVALR